MNDKEIEEVSSFIARRYFLVKRSSAYYFMGGAVAVVFTIFGVSMTGLNSRVEALFDERALEEIEQLKRNLVADAQALETDIEKARALASDRAAVARFTEDRLVYTEDAPPSRLGARSAGMAVVLKGSTDGRATGMPIDHDHFVDLCADLDGCTVEIAVYPRAGGLIEGRSFLEVQRSGGKCTFFYQEASGVWSVSDPCTVWTRALRNNNGELVDPGDGTGKLEGFMPYVPSTTAGIDGHSSDLYEARAPMAYANWCFLSQSPNSSSGPGIVQDSEQGFHLVMAGTDWTGYREQFFPSRDPDRYCLLLIDD